MRRGIESGVFVLALILVAGCRARGRPEHEPFGRYVARGPIDLSGQGTLAVFRLTQLPRPAPILARGEREWRISESLANVLTIDGNDHELDYEMLQTRASLGFGLGDGATLRIEFQDRYRGGGMLDQFIRTFHEAFDLNPNKRDNVKKGRNAFRFETVGDEPGVDLGDGHVLARDLIVSLGKATVVDSLDLLTSLDVTTRLSLNKVDELEGEVPLDLGLAAGVWRGLTRRVFATVQLGYTTFGERRLGAFPLRSSQTAGLVGLEWAFRSWSLNVQYLVSEGVSETRRIFKNKSHELTLGCQIGPPRGWNLEFALMENLRENETAPDLGLHVGITGRF